jgi:FG-GAP-like repeat/ASPIC and UnbV/PPIC-type PPIASE domain
LTRFHEYWRQHPAPRRTAGCVNPNRYIPGHCGALGRWLFFPCILLLTPQLLFAQNSAGQTVGLRIIVVDSAAEADRVLARLKRGEDFAAIAKEISIDPNAGNGGYIGRVDPTSLRAELRDGLKGVAPGQLSAVIHIPSGYAIMQVQSVSDEQHANPAAKQSSTQQPNQPDVSATAPGSILPLSAAGTIRYSPLVGGKGEADLAFRSVPKPEGWAGDLQEMCKIRKDSLAMVIHQLLEDLAHPDSGDLGPKNPLDVIEMRYALANLYSYHGDMAKAIDQWEAAYVIATEQLPPAMAELEDVLAIAYLHKAEMENDVYSKPGVRCLFPPSSSVRYARTDSVQKSISYALKYLARRPDALDVRWFLNLDYLALGQYPDGVPKEFLIPRSAFESPESVGRFQDVAPEAGISIVSDSGGLIVDDFENNGLLDVVTSDYDECAPMHLFHNNGDGTFADHTAKSGLQNQLGGLNMIQADYNNDGCLDILVLRGAWEFPQRKSLLRNNCDGTFTDVTVPAGLADPPTSTQTAVWADIDNDGYLDLFVGNEKGPSQLFHNNGDGTFKDISHTAGVDRIAFTKGVVAADFDNDGYVDFYVSNLNGNNFLYRNNHDGTFTDVAAEAGVQKPWQSFAVWFFDYDNDGLPDLFVTSYYVSTEETLRSYLGLTPNAETLKLYRNIGDGTFRDVTAQTHLDRVFMPMGANFGDIDNDGFLDIYLGTGNPTYGSILPNVLLHNKDGKFFTDITASSGTGELHKGHAVAFADLGNNGHEDLLEEVGGAVPGDAHAFRLFKNPGNDKDWITVHLVGVKSNRSAIGARIKVTVQDGEQPPRAIYRTVGSGGSFGGSPLQQHIGLGKSARIVDLEVWWPSTQTRQNFAGVNKNQFIEIKEFEKNYTVLERHTFQLPIAHDDAAAANAPLAPASAAASRPDAPSATTPQSVADPAADPEHQ